MIVHCYRLSEELCLESFGDESILFIADWDRLLTLDTAAARLFSLLQAKLGTKPFSRTDLTLLLREHYELSAADVDAEVAKLLAFGLQQKIVLKG